MKHETYCSQCKEDMVVHLYGSMDSQYDKLDNTKWLCKECEKKKDNQKDNQK